MNQKKDAFRLDEWGDPIPASDEKKPAVQSAADAFEKSLYETDWDASPQLSKETSNKQSPIKLSRNIKAWIMAAVCMLAAVIFIVVRFTGPNGQTAQDLQNVAQDPKKQDQIIQTEPLPESTKTAQSAEQKPSAAPTHHAVSVQTSPPVTATPKITNTPKPDLMAAAKEWYETDLRYYYLQLSAHEKTLFELLYSGISSFSRQIEIASGHFTKEELDHAAFAIGQDCPELFHYSGEFTYYYIGSDTYTSVSPDYRMSQDEYNRKKSRIQQIIRDLKGKTQSLTNDFEKEKLVYRYIIDHCEYVDAGLETSRADSVLCDGRAQCAGYSRGLSLLLRSLNIPCLQVSSAALDHEWNLVQINDHWYHCDITWDDNSSESARPKKTDFMLYLNVPSRLMAKHIPDQEEGFFLPSCTHLEDNFIYREGIYISSNTQDIKAELNRRLNEAYHLGKREIVIMIDDWPAFNNRKELISDFSSAHSIVIWTSEETETCSFFLEVKE